MNQVPKDHPRYNSLLMREKLVEGQRNGLLAPVAAIAHGRGEAFDYLLGEKTCDSAEKALQVAAMLLLKAKNPVISVNGNTAVLSRENLFDLAKVVGCPLEINIFYRTTERMGKLLNFLSNNQGVEILGKDPDARIPGLSSERAKCTKKGIFSADVVFVPLEDGDRCEALRKMGKTVIAVDLNPFSRTARTASLTIVDNISRCIPGLIEIIKAMKTNNSILKKSVTYNNSEFLVEAVEEMKTRIENFQKDPSIDIK